MDEAAASQVCDRGLSKRTVGIDEHGKARGSRQQLVQEPEPLCRELHIHGADTGDVAARPVEAGDETSLDRVAAGAEDDRNCRGRGFGRECRWHAARCGDDGHPAADQIGRQFRQSIVLTLCPAVFDRDVLAFDVAGFAQPFAECRHEVVRSAQANPRRDIRSPASPAAARAPQRPRRRGAAEQRDELAPPHMCSPQAEDHTLSHRWKGVLCKRT